VIIVRKVIGNSLNVKNVNVVKMDQLVLLVMTKTEFVNARKIILVKNVICAKLKPTDTLIVNLVNVTNLDLKIMTVMLRLVNANAKLQ